LRLRFPRGDVERMHALSAKAKEGALTADEDQELEDYIRVGHLGGPLSMSSR
jgi:hypothetical protein